jgi:polyphenol oxidase
VSEIESEPRSSIDSLVEYYPGLKELPVIHGFTLRVPGLDVQTERAEALARLRHFHSSVIASKAQRSLKVVRQVHGNRVLSVSRNSPEVAGEADGMITDDPEVALGIFVADCCAIYLIDPVRRAIGLLHAGKKGTAQNIVEQAIRKFESAFGSDSSALVAQLSPCIRPPHYEIDFAAAIKAQLQTCGVRLIQDCNSNTAEDLSRYYSYRMEKGRTGRMLAFLALR